MSEQLNNAIEEAIPSKRVMTNIFRIDETLRHIKIPTNGRIAGVTGDKDVKNIDFVVNRYYNGLDLQSFSIKINYVNAKGEPNYYDVKNVEFTDTSLVFSWQITSDITKYKGEVKFNVEFIRHAEGEVLNVFNTEVNHVIVLEGLNVDEYIDPGGIESLLDKLKKDLDEYVKMKESEFQSVVSDNIIVINDHVEQQLESADQTIQEYVSEAIEEIKSFIETLDNNIVFTDTTANWNSIRDLVSKKNCIYVYSDYYLINGEHIPAIKVGDGTTYLIDLPIVNDMSIMLDHINDKKDHVTDEEREFWNSKVRCFISKENEEHLIFTDK